MSRIRTFVAVEVSDGVRKRAAGLVERLRTTGAKASWVDPQNLHSTLCFLGDVDDREVNDVCQVVEGAVANVEPFQAQCAGLGAFPNVQRPRTIWLGIDDESDRMCSMQAQIAIALEPLGFAREKRVFRPHLTLGRVRGGGAETRALCHMIEDRADFDAGQFFVREVVVFSSQLERGGPVYKAMSRAALGSGL